MMGRILLMGAFLTARPVGQDTVIERMERGVVVRIACFGDSITGRYYHTGSRLAWPEMLEQGLRRLYPKARIDVVNAGLSGNTTGAGLRRMDRDVLRCRPHLVIVMYGMNDLGGNRPDVFAANLRAIIKRCRRAGAAVLLATQNNIHPNAPRRPIERLARYTQIIRDVGAATRVPVADCYAAYEAVLGRDRKAWAMLMSETIHPNLNGHRLFVQTIIERLTGKRLPPEALPNSRPAIPTTLARIRSDRPKVKVAVVGMGGGSVARALRQAFPKATFQVTARILDPPSVVALRKQADKLLKDRGEHVLVVALPAEPLTQSFESYKRTIFWVVRHSVPFGFKPKARDVVWVMPSVLGKDLSPRVRQREKDMLALAHSHDIGAIRRPAGDERPAAEIIAQWLREQDKAQ